MTPTPFFRFLAIAFFATVSPPSSDAESPAPASRPQWHGPHGTRVAAPGDYPIEFSPEKNVAWKVELPGVGSSTPVARDGKVYLLTGRGEIHCLDARTGIDFWAHAIPRAAAKYDASPILAGNLLYCAREDGLLTVVEVNDTGMKVLAQNDLGERLAAAPVPGGGRLLARGVGWLVCVQTD